MVYKIRRVRLEEYAYYVQKLRQNVGLEIWIWRQIVTSQTAHTKCKWPLYETEWKPPHENFLRTPLLLLSFSALAELAHKYCYHRNKTESELTWTINNYVCGSLNRLCWLTELTSKIFCLNSFLHFGYKGYLVEFLKVVSLLLYFSLFTLMISLKLPLFILLYLLMILIFVCRTPILMSFRKCQPWTM